MRTTISSCYQVSLARIFCSVQGSATSWTEPATNDITWGFALFFGGFVQLLAGQVRCVYAHHVLWPRCQKDASQMPLQRTLMLAREVGACVLRHKLSCYRNHAWSWASLKYCFGQASNL